MSSSVTNRFRTDSFEVSPGAATLAFTRGNLGTDADTPYKLQQQGKGWGLDLGLVYEYVGDLGIAMWV